MELLGQNLPKEQARVREILGHYREIGPPGAFGAKMIEAVLKKADKAIIGGNLIEMISVYQELKGING